MIDYSLYLITDDPSRYSGDWLENVLAAVEGGVTVVQYRDTESSSSVKYERLNRLKNALKPRHIPLIVNNDVDLAIALGAEGVHVGQHDLPVPEVRRLVGPSSEIGFSITSPADAAAFLSAPFRNEVSVLGVGPVFDARKTKIDAADALGLSELSALVHSLSFPTVAIGGITLENAASVLAAGVDGLAVVSAFSKSIDPYATAKNFSLLLDNRRQ